MTDPQWIRTLHMGELRPHEPQTYRHEGLSILLLACADGVFATQANCPHQGYPLSAGSVSRIDGVCVLSCPWHNWKFALDDGRNLLGGDRLRTFPVRINDDIIEVDVSRPDLAVAREQAHDALREAFDEADYERMARELFRYQRANGSLSALVRAALAWTQPRLQWGWTHALPGTTDWLRLFTNDARSAQERVLCALEAIHHLARDGLRHPEYPFTEPDGYHWDDADFADAVENEDSVRACGLVAAALRDGVTRSEIDRALARAALAHYNDFGHSLIYACKAAELLDLLGDSHAGAVYPGLARALVFAVREDALADFRDYGQTRKRFAEGPLRSPLPSPDELYGLGVRRLLRALADAGGTPPEQAFETLLAVNAWNLLHFTPDVRSSRSERDNVSWLDVTHGITFADAVRACCTRWPELWPAGLAQMACFAGRNARYTAAKDEGNDDLSLRDRHWLAGAVRTLFDRDNPEPIVHVHRVKTTLAVRRLLEGELEPATRALLVRGLHRYLNAPLRRADPRRTVRRALADVERSQPAL